MKAKFWFINIVALATIGVYLFITIVEIVNGDFYINRHYFYEANVFEICVLGSFSYLFKEGMLVHKAILSKKISDDGTIDEFGVVDRSQKRNGVFTGGFLNKKNNS